MVLEARDSAEAVQISKRHEGPIHLMVTNGVIPGIRGREFERPRARMTTPVILVDGEVVVGFDQKKLSALLALE